MKVDNYLILMIETLVILVKQSNFETEEYSWIELQLVIHVINEKVDSFFKILGS